MVSTCEESTSEAPGTLKGTMHTPTLKHFKGWWWQSISFSAGVLVFVICFKIVWMASVHGTKLANSSYTLAWSFYSSETDGSVGKVLSCCTSIRMWVCILSTWKKPGAGHVPATLVHRPRGQGVSRTCCPSTLAEPASSGSLEGPPQN